MNINDLYRINNQGDMNRFVSLVPGTELSECLEAIINYCKENNTSAKLEFNGVINKVESWIDPAELANVWFDKVPKEWYDEQRVKQRDKRIDQVVDL